MTPNGQSNSHLMTPSQSVSQTVCEWINDAQSPSQPASSPCEWWSDEACPAGCAAAAAEDWLSPPWPVWSSDSASSGSLSSPGVGAGALQTNTQRHRTDSASQCHTSDSFIRFSIVSRRGGWCTANQHTASQNWLSFTDSASQCHTSDSFIRFSIVSRRGGWCTANQHTASQNWLSFTVSHEWQLHQVLYRLQAWGPVHCKPTHSITHDTQLHSVTRVTASSGSLSSPGVETANWLSFTVSHEWQLHQVLYRLQAWGLVHCKPTHSVTELTQLYQVLYHLQARGLVHCKLTHSVTHDWLNFIRFPMVYR